MKYKGFTVDLNQGYYKAFRSIEGKTHRVYVGKDVSKSETKIDEYIQRNAELFNRVFEQQNIQSKLEQSEQVIQEHVEQIAMLQKKVVELQKIIEKQQLQIELLQKQKPAPVNISSAESITGQDIIHREKILGFEIYRKEGKSFWYARRDIKGHPHNVKIGNDVANANRMILRYLAKHPDIEEYLMREK